jgi:hypothetical protein
MRRPAPTISNQSTTLSEAIAQANALYGLGLPLLKDLPSGTTLYAMWQISVTVQQPGPNPGELMLISATDEFALFGGLSAGVTLTIADGETRAAPRRALAAPAPKSFRAKQRPPATRARR